MGKFKVSFMEKKKYFPATRTIGVDTVSPFNAMELMYRSFGRKSIVINSVIGEDGRDYLQPVPTTKDTQSDKKVTMMQNGDLLIKNGDNERILELSKATMSETEDISEMLCIEKECSNCKGIGKTDINNVDCCEKYVDCNGAGSYVVGISKEYLLE